MKISRPLLIISRISLGRILSISYKKLKTGHYISRIFYLSWQNSIVLEFYDEPTIICYFYESFKLSIKVKLEQQDQISTIFEEIVQKAINAKVKAKLRASFIVRDIDFYYYRCHCSSYNTLAKVQT